MEPWRYISTIHDLELDGGEWPASRLFILREIPSETLWLGGWVGNRAGLDIVEKRKIVPHPGFEPRPCRRRTGRHYSESWSERNSNGCGLRRIGFIAPHIFMNTFDAPNNFDSRWMWTLYSELNGDYEGTMLSLSIHFTRNKKKLSPTLLDYWLFNHHPF
jgi:hypothetical protein